MRTAIALRNDSYSFQTTSALLFAPLNRLTLTADWSKVNSDRDYEYELLETFSQRIPRIVAKLTKLDRNMFIRSHHLIDDAFVRVLKCVTDKSYVSVNFRAGVPSS
jgi:hypothetical protein